MYICMGHTERPLPQNSDLVNVNVKHEVNKPSCVCV